MTLPYVQIEFNEAREAKKKLLSSQINLLTIIKKIDSFKSKRKQELDKKYLVKQELKSNLAKLNSLLLSLPESSSENIKIKHTTLKSEPTIRQGVSRKSQDIEMQLSDIRDQLSKL